MSKGDELVEAAIVRLARGDGCGSLRDLGIQLAEARRDAGAGSSAAYTHFRERGKGAASRGLVEAVMDRLLEEQLQLRKAAAAMYFDRADLVSDGGGRKTVTNALLSELANYGAVADADDLTRARERVYYLAVALSDASTTSHRRAISEADQLQADLRFRRHVLEMHGRYRAELLEVYKGFLTAAGREPVHDAGRIERVISAFLEGVLLVRRVVQGHGKLAKGSRDRADEELALNDEELTDAVLRIFIAMSKPAGGVDMHPDAILFGRDPAAAGPTATEAVLHQDRGHMYATIVETIENLAPADTLSHCALHTSGARPSRTDEGKALRDAVSRFVGRGGTFRNLERVNSVAQLDTTLARLSEGHDPARKETLRVLVMDAPPSLSPLIAGERTAFLGREVDGLIVDAAAFTDPHGRRWCEDHYDVLWNDDRAYTIVTPNGLNEHGIGDARRRLELLERARTAA